MTADVGAALERLVDQVMNTTEGRERLARAWVDIAILRAALPSSEGQADELADVVAGADHCHGIVTHDGEMDVCGKPPVAIVDGRLQGEDYWPACAYHANRYGGGRCVPLAQILAAARSRIEATS